MRRVAASVVATAVVAGGLLSAATSSSAVATSTASHRSVRLTGAVMKGVSYTVVGGTVTALTVTIKGAALGHFTVVTARYGGSLAVPCVIGLYDAAGDQTPVTCTGLAEKAGRPRDLLVAAS